LPVEPRLDVKKHDQNLEKASRNALVKVAGTSSHINAPALIISKHLIHIHLTLQYLQPRLASENFRLRWLHDCKIDPNPNAQHQPPMTTRGMPFPQGYLNHVLSFYFNSHHVPPTQNTTTKIVTIAAPA
jgi:hypothetical protein